METIHGVLVQKLADKTEKYTEIRRCSNSEIVPG